MNRDQQRIYDAMIAAASDPRGELFIVWGPSEGPYEFYARTGGAHRVEFWRGFDGIDTCAADKSSLAYACWLAGRDARKRGIEPAASAGRIDPMTGRAIRRPQPRSIKP